MKSTTTRKKRTQTKAPLASVNSDPYIDSSDEEEQDKKEEEDDDEVMIIDGNAPSTITQHAQESVDKLINEKRKQVNDDVEANSSHSILPDNSKSTIDMTLVEKEVKMYQALLSKLNPSSDHRAISTTDEVVITPADLARTRVNASTHSSLINIPIVKTQLERKRAEATRDAAGIDVGKPMTFVTKLNNKHVWQWQIGSKETFAKVKDMSSSQSFAFQ